MSNDGQTLVREYVDAALAYLAAHELMREPAFIVDAAMLDSSQPITAGLLGDMVAWKPIASTATEADIHELEAAIGHSFPALYVAFLRYRHFYELDEAAGISFIMHDVKEWKAGLWDHYFFLHEPGTLRQQGYIQFAYDLDLKPICFDFAHCTPDGQDCAVVRVLDLYQDPAPTQRLYGSFFDLLLDMRAAQVQRDALDK
ncbi:SMI1/KNR4 family protein [Hymenobacter sp. BT683]|uniref:SMI1/KNR4 family protein n=1 Tax=Hymenobacter jeongseonensis TaxID=2791027 RepID=A0ABS0INN5_9BACT|nr:SMI1/KNR4 family protein [Hymenobacter jeongseonensis]MBF9239787.1 SMI1/KNR4 family protein [Hymenobacter jeongseonensis]